MSTTAAAAPLEGPMLTMDIADTARRLADGADEAAPADEELAAALSKLYARQGMAVSEAEIRDGIAALRDERFAYAPSGGGIGRWLAYTYVTRRQWAPVAMGLAVVLVVAFGAYFFAWRPFHDAQLAAERVELTQTLPAAMDALYDTIYTETKVQQAVIEATQIRNQGKTAATAGDRGKAEQAVTQLTAIRDRLRQEYTLRIVNRDGIDTGFWRFPKENTAATNFYVVVEAVDPQGNLLTLPIADEETGKTDNVSVFALRVPEPVYRTVMSDRGDDGVLEQSVLGIKESGFLDIDFAMPVLGGSLAHW